MKNLKTARNLVIFGLALFLLVGMEMKTGQLLGFIIGTLAVINIFANN